MEKLAPNSIELWAINAEKEFALSKRPMSREEAAVLEMVSPIEKTLSGRFLLEDELEHNRVPIPNACVFYNRVRTKHTYTVSGPLASFVGFVSKSFGEAVMYANYLQYKAFKQGKRYLDLNFFLTECFPDGFPTDEVLKKMWNAQMVDLVNMLDYVEGQKSISFKK